ncbi:hypothetical protein [Bradyrhizobium sp. USDA 10063]
MKVFNIFPKVERPSGRAALMLLFWSYIATLIERLLQTAKHAVPPRALDDTLRRK